MFWAGGLKASAQILCATQECALYWLILLDPTGSYWTFQGSAQFSVTVSTSSGFARADSTCLPSIVTTLSGGECHYSFPFLIHHQSVFSSACFPSSLFLSLHILIHLGVWWGSFCLFSWFGFCGVGFFECVCIFFDCFTIFVT